MISACLARLKRVQEDRDKYKSLLENLVNLVEYNLMYTDVDLVGEIPCTNCGQVNRRFTDWLDRCRNNVPFKVLSPEELGLRDINEK